MLIRQRWKLVAILSLAVLLLGACSSGGGFKATSRPVIADADLIEASYKAAGVLVQQAKLDPSFPIIAASFADINQLDGSSSFGRIVSQQFASAFSKSGYKVVEMLLRNNVYIRRGEGEFLLSREIRNLSVEHNIQAVVVGTYAIGAENVYMTAKIIRTPDSVVVAAHDFTLPLGPDTKSLLRN